MQDRSPQGFIDSDIQNLLDRINGVGDYETTSSCSGRIVIFSGKKGSGVWLFKSHEMVGKREILDALRGASGMVWFLQEPMILHVRCKSLDSAKKILGAANSAGLRKSGLISIRNSVVEIKGSERIETPLDSDNIQEDFVGLLVDEANKKLRKTKEWISVFDSEVCKMFSLHNEG